MLEITNENFARLLKGLTIAVGNRKNRILFYQFLAAEIRALHYSNLVRNSAEHHVEVTIDHAKRIFLRALKKLNASPALAADLEPSAFTISPKK